MSSADRWVFSFLYTRRGLTDLWDSAKAKATKVAPGGPWEGPGTRFAATDGKLEWVEVAVEADPAADRDDLLDDAEQQADAFFLGYHPEADIAE